MKDVLQSYTGLSQMTLRLLERFTDPVVIVTPDSRFLYANMPAATLSRVRTPKDLVERYYPEVKSPLFENQQVIEHWQQQDQKIMINPLNKLKMLEIHPGAAICPYINRKIPLYNESGELIAIAQHVKYLEVYRPNDFIMGKIPGSLLLNRPDDFFTEKECEIIFLRLQRMPSKTIAKILNLSPRTIENTIYRLYDKAKVGNATDFEEFCEKRDLHRYLPHRFIDPERFSFGDGSIEL